MVHAHHELLPGYAPGMLLVDGCPECEKRVTESPLLALLHLDEERQLHAWRLMRAMKWSTGDGVDRPLSDCENALLDGLYNVAVWLQRGGIEPDEVERRFEIRLLEVKQSLGMAGEDGAMRLLALRIADRQEEADRVAQALAGAQGVSWASLSEIQRQSLRLQGFAAMGAMRR